PDPRRGSSDGADRPPSPFGGRGDSGHGPAQAIGAGRSCVPAGGVVDGARSGCRGGGAGPGGQGPGAPVRGRPGGSGDGPVPIRTVPGGPSRVASLSANHRPGRSEPSDRGFTPGAGSAGEGRRTGQGGHQG